MKKILFFALISSQMALGQGKLVLEEIMQGEDFVGHSPTDIQWDWQSSQVFYRQKQKGKDLPQWSRASKNQNWATAPLPDSLNYLRERQGQETWRWNREQTQVLILRRGQLYLGQRSSGEERLLLRWNQGIQSLDWSENQQAALFTNSQGAYRLDLQTGSLEQLCEFNKGNKNNEKKTSIEERWLEQQQLNLFKVIQEEDQARKANEAWERRWEQKMPVLYLEGRQLDFAQVHPSGRYVIYRTSQRSENRSTKLMQEVTASGYAEEMPARPKVGTVGDPNYRLFIHDLAQDSSIRVLARNLPKIYDKPHFMQVAGGDSSQNRYPNPRPVIFHPIKFSAQGAMLTEARAMDNKDRWLVLLASDGSYRVLDQQSDTAWIGGPGISSWTGVPGDYGWLPDGEQVWYQSELTGFSNLYVKNIQNLSSKNIHSGAFEISEVVLNAAGTHFYFLCSEGDLRQRKLYRCKTDGTERQILTSAIGGYEYWLSPDERWIALRYSTATRPWELGILPNTGRDSVRWLTDSRTAAFKAYPWREPLYVEVPASDGAKVPGRLYLPKKKGKNQPAVIFVHGAGYLQNAHRWWSSYHREYMFHNFLADQGYVVLDLDFRASAGYGRDWRTAIYRHMGSKDWSDQVDGAAYLVKSQGVDAKRIGIYGGSYGGFITLMAMFKSPEVFKAGAALRSVTDWAHYNHPYTANILNTPTQDSLAYVRSSPIYFAEGLKGRLLILHGMVDSNVQFQDVVRLSQRLIELGKENWEMAVYPVENHGFIRSDSWTDEYKRIYKLFEEELKR